MSLHSIVLLSKDGNRDAIGIRSIRIQVEAPNQLQAGQDALVTVTRLLGDGFRERQEIKCRRCGGCGREGGGGDMTCQRCFGSGKQWEDS